jgi:hypothetical protein
VANHSGWLGWLNTICGSFFGCVCWAGLCNTMLAIHNLILFVLVILTPTTWVLIIDVGYESWDLFLHFSLKLVVCVVDIDFVMERPSHVKINRFWFVISDMGGFWILQGTCHLIKWIGWFRLSNCPSKLVPDYSWLFKHYFIFALERLLEQESRLT